MSYGRWCPQQMRVARSTSTQCQSDYYQHSTLINIAHLPFSNQLSCFVPQPSSSMFSSAFISSFDLLPQIQCPSQDMTILSPQHIPPNTVYHSQLFYAFIQNQHQLLFDLSDVLHRLLSAWISVLCKIPISLTFKHHATPKYRIAGLT